MTAAAFRFAGFAQPWRAAPKLVGLYFAAALLGTAALVAVRPHLPPAPLPAPADRLPQVDYVTPSLITTPPLPSERSPVPDLPQAPPEADPLVAGLENGAARTARSVLLTESPTAQVASAPPSPTAVTDESVVVRIGPYFSRRAATAAVSALDTSYGLSAEIERKGKRYEVRVESQISDSVADSIKSSFRRLQPKVKVSILPAKTPTPTYAGSNGQNVSPSGTAVGAAAGSSGGTASRGATGYGGSMSAPFIAGH